MYSSFAAGGTLNSRRAASPRVVSGRGGGMPLTSPGVPASKLGWNSKKASSSLIRPLRVVISRSERCHLHDDQAQDALDRPGDRKKCTSTANCVIGRPPGTCSTFTGVPVSSRTIRCRLAERLCTHYFCSGAHPSTPSFGVVRGKRKLDCSGIRTRSSLVTNPDSISAVIIVVFVCGYPVVNVLIPSLLYSGTSVTAGVMVWVPYPSIHGQP
ncbi:hypothetical protein TNCV_2197521 [Trichonephila clavipes]|nr:hypothetical protein TNCV_2197521 [Trichonephila clavipes]